MPVQRVCDGMTLTTVLVRRALPTVGPWVVEGRYTGKGRAHWRYLYHGGDARKAWIAYTTARTMGAAVNYRTDLPALRRAIQRKGGATPQ